MDITQILSETKRMIDELKTVCANKGLGNSSSEYKIITETFLYKYLNDKFLFEVRNTDSKWKNCTNLEAELAQLSEDDYLDILDELPPTTAQLKKEHMISYLFNHKNDDDFDVLFDSTLVDIANYNINVFSVKTGEEKIKLFDPIAENVIEKNKRIEFCRAIIDKLVEFSFEEACAQKYDFFAAVFEYLIKDYNKDFGKFAEYYTPHTIATIIANILVPEGDSNVTVYDPAAGSGTLVLALAHAIGEDKCTLYTQDQSQKSNEFLRLNLILNNLVHSLGNVVHDDTLVSPQHYNAQKTELRKFDYIVSNPPFNVDFSDTRDTLAGSKYSERFWAGVPNIPKKDKKSMSIYLMFIQHILFSLKDGGRAAIVLPSGFLTDTGAIHTTIRDHIMSKHSLKAVIQMPTNVFANTNTSVSIIFIDTSVDNQKVMLVDASHLGTTIKVDDNARTVLSEDECSRIINAINNRETIAEFSIEASVDDICDNQNFIKPGLYFQMEYDKLTQVKPDLSYELNKLEQKKKGLLREIRESYVRNTITDWFVEYNCPAFCGDKYETEYGELPVELELTPLADCIAETLGGEWGKEAETGNYKNPIRCIRGTDIPNMQIAYYEDVPVRYVQKKHIEEKAIQENDIIVEISGGSPVQSTGRLCLITQDMLDDLQLPVLCTNFCRIMRLKDQSLAEYIYCYLQMLYLRGYFFNLENNTTGIKNLIFSAFTSNIKIPIPKDRTILQALFKRVEDLIQEL